MLSKLAGLFCFRKPAAAARPTPRSTLQVESLDERVVPAVVTVGAQANIYAAGTPVVTRPPSPGGGGGGVRPQEVSLAALGNPVKLEFPTVTGVVSGWAARGGYNGADGGPSWGGKTLVPAHGGISGIRHDGATMFLVGVFLGPTGRPAEAPPTLDVTRANTAATSAPALAQQFFIGDGKTKAGTPQTVKVPAGATTLYLGFAEGWGFGLNRKPGFYDDNGGKLKVDVRAVPDIKALGAQTTATGVRYQYAATGAVPQVRVSVYQSADPKLDQFDTPVASRVFTPQANSSGAGDLSFPGFTPTPQRPYLLVVFDVDNLLHEGDEGNNVAVVQHHWTAKDATVRVPDSLRARIDRVADLYFFATGKSLVVTDGQRTVAEQASAMLAKLTKDGVEKVRGLYANKSLVNEVIVAYQSKTTAAARLAAMTATIQSQVDRDEYISRHLTGMAFDVRSNGMTKADQAAFKAAATRAGGVLVNETTTGEPHFHVQF